MSVKMAFHVADAMITPGAAVVAPAGGVYTPVLGLNGMSASYGLPAKMILLNIMTGFIAGIGALVPPEFDVP